ncbi:tRNA (adenosine(37)-N6)-threonylcarbamoyltransferase complex ATPase subunit type 1 TsaE [Patescibacteria group bacterium]|nr:tRNA (adenosine(37)-N6)-threonylcarbamoyltransferase complex ATPase subunit type 1 TsaE [Patescibacteria group bacterium]
MDGRKTQRTSKYLGRNSVGVRVFTQSFRETQKLGKELAENLIPGQIMCLSGDLGTGKTTFVQGILKGLKVKGPYTSPTFVIMKQYHTTWNIKHGTEKNKLLHAPCSMLHDVYHIDAYRVSDKDILNLGWEEIISQPDNLIVIEWAEKIKKIIPANARWINFFWEGEKKRKIVFK